MARLSVSAQARVARILANLILVGLVIYLALFLARITWLVLWNEVPVAPLTGASHSAASGQELRYPMASYPFFGKPSDPAVVSEVARRSVPETGLRLRLEGVLVGLRPEDSGAIVAGSNGKTEYYRVGDTLPGNAELAEVEPHRILILRNGQYESLAFEETIVSGVVAEEAPPPPQNGASPDAFLADARSQLDSQGVAALKAYGLSPVDDSGMSGYVYDGSSPMLNAVNLKAGDVITAINGQRLGDLTQDKTLLDNWRGQSQLEIEIERNGTILTVSYAIPEQWR